MASLTEVFGAAKVALPVIHVEDEAQALRNVEIASVAGAHGVFLINHSIAGSELLRIAHSVLAEHDVWVGLNLLDHSPAHAFGVLPHGVAGYWSDNAGINPGTRNPTAEQSVASGDLDARARSDFTGLYFGGVAFKYQTRPVDLGATTRAATRFMDVITTSGAGTGQAADLHKIRTMHEAAGGHPLGIASGVTPDNIDAYLPYIDAFLVATGISKAFTELDPTLAERLCERVRAFG